MNSGGVVGVFFKFLLLLLLFSYYYIYRGNREAIFLNIPT